MGEARPLGSLNLSKEEIMNNHIGTGGQYSLNRPSYALRVAGCLLGFLAYGTALGMAFQSSFIADPLSTIERMAVFIFIGNAVAGAVFSYLTYRRALDCEFGQKGKAWIALLACLPTLALPQYALLVFGVIMLFRSASDRNQAVEDIDKPGVIRSLEAGE